jgi:hypothetical protein
MVARMRHDRIIESFGGNKALARLIGRSDSAISRWRDNGIPPQFWVALATLSRKHAEQEITLEAIAIGPPGRAGNHRSRSPRAERVA